MTERTNQPLDFFVAHLQKDYHSRAWKIALRLAGHRILMKPIKARLHVLQQRDLTSQPRLGVPDAQDDLQACDRVRWHGRRK
jgi:hypothetical protein